MKLWHCERETGNMFVLHTEYSVFSLHLHRCLHCRSLLTLQLFSYFNFCRDDLRWRTEWQAIRIRIRIIPSGCAPVHMRDLSWQ